MMMMIMMMVRVMVFARYKCGCGVYKLMTHFSLNFLLWVLGLGRVHLLTGTRFWAIVLDRWAVEHAPARETVTTEWLITTLIIMITYSMPLLDISVQNWSLHCLSVTEAKMFSFRCREESPRTELERSGSSGQWLWPGRISGPSYLCPDLVLCHSLYSS